MNRPADPELEEMRRALAVAASRGYWGPQCINCKIQIIEYCKFYYWTEELKRDIAAEDALNRLKVENRRGEFHKKHPKPKTKPKTVCGLCWRSLNPLNMRAHYELLDGEKALRGIYCTDCYYLEILKRPEPTLIRRRLRSRGLPDLYKQENLDRDQLLIRSCSHRDLRREFGFMGQFGMERFTRQESYS